MVAATKKEKKLVKDPRTARATRKGKKKAAAKVAGQSDKFATDQQALIPDADERIQELQDECQFCLGERDKKKAAKQAEDESKERIKKLLGKYDLQLYICNGCKFYVEPGEPTVKIVSLNLRG